MKQPVSLLNVAAQSQYFVKCFREIVITRLRPTSINEMLKAGTNVISHPLGRT